MEGKNQAQAIILKISHFQSLTWTSEKTEAIIFNNVLHKIDPLEKLRQSYDRPYPKGLKGNKS